MERIDFVTKVKQQFDELPGRIRVAASYVLDHPEDVALLSMREQARRAGVPPATMTRFAQHMGLPGYDEVRAIHAAALREAPVAYGGRAENLVRRHREVGNAGVATEMLERLAVHLSEVATPSRVERLAEAARDMVAARRIYCLGHRSSFPVAFQFNYLLSFFDSRSILLDATGGVGHPNMLDAAPGDVLLVICYRPAARHVIEATAFARRQGVRVIAITDSEANAISRLAHLTLLTPCQSPSFFDTVTPAFAVCETLVALIAGLHPGDVAASVARSEAKLWELGVWWGEEEALPAFAAPERVRPDPAQASTAVHPSADAVVHADEG
ncbi:MurR/RpiR family transcriptional regulator [Ancylobacter pratisalsi]|uniref:MurR/RpiR family transcriptional regulator n=1 Tax=Ancylobacter pratisalsi TaxID=1745854 RepID=A0A6P1YME4_9HYPH|nr:MurR/RpiR family transcriptional regulator [Ancylobacter pratisalsi]QIB34252.1 MurR/RpiR family transcriptional regulator [Ancylobacter pratisalsi]